MKMNLKALHRSKMIFCLAIIVILCLFCLRVTKLDTDLPQYGVGAYNPSDEGIYAVMALNMYNYGNINPTVQVNDELSVTPYTAHHCRNNLLSNVLVYTGLQLFGDNYFGFRFPMVVVSLLNLLLMMHITWALVKRYGKGKEYEKWIVVGVELFYTLSFPYLISSRVVEPTILRLLSLLVIFDLFLYVKSNKARFFWMGFVATLSVQLVYVSQLFVYIPIFMAGCVIGWSRGKKEFRNSALFCMTGCIASLAVCATYFYLVWGSDFVSNSLQIYRDFSNVPGYTTLLSEVDNSGLLNVISYSILTFLSANTFLYHMPLLTAFLLYVPALVKMVLKRRDEVLTFSLMAVGGLLLQTCFTNDYISRKAFLIQPFVVFSLIVLLLSRRAEREEEEIKPKVEGMKRWLKGIYIAGVLLLVFYCLHYRLYQAGSPTVKDFTNISKLLLLTLQGGGALITAFLVVWSRNRPKAFRYAGVTILLCCAFATNCIYADHYVWRNQATTEKDVMINLDRYSGQVVFGAYSYGYTLYNDIKPVLLGAKEFGEVVNSYPEDSLYIDMSIDFGNYVQDYLQQAVYQHSRYIGVQTQVLHRLFGLNGETLDYALYTPILKSNLDYHRQLIKLEKMTSEARAEKEREKEEKEARYRKTAIELYEMNAEFQKRLLVCQNEEEELVLRMRQNENVQAVFERYEIKDYELYLFNDNMVQSCYGDINTPLYGSIYGNVYGNINATVYGDIYGDVHGHINVPIYGVLYGEVIEPKK